MRSLTRFATATVLTLTLATVGASSEVAAEPIPLAGMSISNLSSEAQSYIEKGDEFVARRSYNRAREQYQKAVKIIRADGDFAAAALYRIAAAYYYDGEFKNAAGKLDEVAREAAEFGDIATHAWALADAAWLLGQVGAKIDVDKHLERLDRLFQSSYLPDQVRDEIIAKRLGEYVRVSGK